MKKATFAVDIAASNEKVWETLWGKETYKAWTTPFAEGSDIQTDWKEGSRAIFVMGDGKGMVSQIDKNIPNTYMAFKHLGTYDNGVEDLESDKVKAWAGALETYSLSGNNGSTHLEITMDTTEEMEEYFNNTFPKALEILKNTAEANFTTQKLCPFLWYNDDAGEAAHHYTSIFKNSRLISMMYNNDAGPAGAAGTVLSATIEINGQELILFNGGPHYKLTPAASMMIICETQEEIDYLWDKLCEGGKPVQCGWLEDKFGLSWQIVPAILPKLFQDKDAEKAKRAVNAMMGMVKLEIKKLKDAFDGVAS